MTRERDTQKSKLYAAERFAWCNWTGWEDKPAGVRGYTDGTLPDAATAQAFVDAALAHDTIRCNFGRSACRKVEVYFAGRGATGGTRIRLGTECRSEWVALHELAHVITIRYFDQDKYKTAFHGAQFAGVYLLLVRSIMGDRAADNLRAAFELYGVKFVKIWEPK